MAAVLDIQRALASPNLAADARAFGEKAIARAEVYFADNMREVMDARERLRHQDDAKSKSLRAYANDLLRSYGEAGRIAAAAITKAIDASRRDRRNARPDHHT